MKHVLSVQDLSCVGRCSLTVALPVLSAMGCRCSVLPTAVLSTHTAFPSPKVVSMTPELTAFADHWRTCGIRFDAVMTGYLSDPEQAKVLAVLAKRWHEEGALVVTDPAMGDDGRLYNGITDEHVAAMRELCRHADVLLPNVTEAALLTGIPYREEADEAYLEELTDSLLSLGPQAVILTGISQCRGGNLPPASPHVEPAGADAHIGPNSTIGIYGAHRTGGPFSYRTEYIPRSFHGTGDLFAAVFTGALMTSPCGSEPVGTDLVPVLGPHPEGTVSSADRGSAARTKDTPSGPSGHLPPIGGQETGEVFTGIDAASLLTAAKTAAVFVKACAANTPASTPHGVRFEPLLKTLAP